VLIGSFHNDESDISKRKMEKTPTLQLMMGTPFPLTSNKMLCD